MVNDLKERENISSRKIKKPKEGKRRKQQILMVNNAVPERIATVNMGGFENFYANSRGNRQNLLPFPSYKTSFAPLTGTVILLFITLIVESGALETASLKALEDKKERHPSPLRRGNRRLSSRPWEVTPSSYEEKFLSSSLWKNSDREDGSGGHDDIHMDDVGGRRDNPLFHCEQPLPSVHFDEDRRHDDESKIALESFYDFARWFHNEYYLHYLAPHTLNQQMFLSQQSVARGPHKQLFTTLWDNPNFVFWGRSGVYMGNEMSAYEDSSTKANAIEGEYMVGGFPHVYVHPSTKPMSRLHNITTLSNGPVPYVAFVSNAIGVYAHFMMDHLPYWIFLKKVFDNPQTRFIFADYEGKNKERMEMLDPEFNSRIHWIQCSHEKRCNTLVRIRQGGSLSVLTTDDLNGRHMALLDLARQWVSQVYPPLPKSQITQPTVIYYTRNSPDVSHSRKIEVSLEERIIKHIRKALVDYNRPEKLIVFDGSNMSMQEQIDLFRSATTVIGPHGGGLSNLFWIEDAPSCQERPRVLEFLISPQTRTVQRGFLGKSWYKLYNTAPWLEYHHIFLVPPSDHETLYINLDDLDEALRVLFAPQLSSLPYP